MKEQHRKGKSTDLDRLFRPRSLAVVGASADSTRGGGFIWWRINEHGYLGRKYPISRSSKELNGVKCYTSLSDIDEPVDMRRIFPTVLDLLDLSKPQNISVTSLIQ